LHQDAAQPQEITGDLEIHDLPLTILEKLVGTGPAGGECICGLIRLPLVDEIPPRDEGAAPLVQGCEHRQFGLRKGDEGAELADKWIVFDHLSPPAPGSVVAIEVAAVTDVDQHSVARFLPVCSA
jgi:hypothetical protein